MFSDTTEETLTLRMGDLSRQLPPKTQLPATSSSTPPSPPPPPLFSLKPEVEFMQDHHGLDFYSSTFDNSFPYRGILNNERTFSSSSPASNTSFLSSETSFNQILKSSQDNSSASDNFGLLTTSSTPYRGTENGSDFQRLMNGNDSGGSFLPQGSALNDSLSSSISIASQKWDSPPGGSSGNQFDFSFSSSADSSSNNFNNHGIGSGSSTSDSPSRFNNGSSLSAFANQWDSGDVSSLLDAQSTTEGSSSLLQSSGFGNSIWSPSQVSANNTGGNTQQWDADTLAQLDKKQLMNLWELLKEKFEESMHDGDIIRISQLQGAMVQVQEQIVNSFANGLPTVTTPTNSIGSPLPMVQSPTDGCGSMNGAKIYRDIGSSKDAPYTWSGHLPPRIHRNPIYSSKVFLGGLPFDITENTLMHIFKPFGIVRIEWPGKEGVSIKPKGYAYAVLENEKQVKVLLQHCTHDYSDSRSGNFYYKMSTKNYRGKDVQIIPWALSDSTFMRCQASKIDSQKTVFVGAVHGMVNAEGLAKIMHDLFGGVVYAGMDTDRNKYPIGSARVTFNNSKSYIKAVTAGFIDIKTPRFKKTLQVDPYLEDATCSVCNLQQGPYFCRHHTCFRYYCRTCFHYKHIGEAYKDHRSLMRTTNNKRLGDSSSPVAPGAPYNWQAHSGFWNGSNNHRQYGGRNTPPMGNNNGAAGGSSSAFSMNGKFYNGNNGYAHGNNGGGGGQGAHGAQHSHHQQQMSSFKNFGQVGGGHRQGHFMRW